MSQSEFTKAIEQIAKAPADQVFESAIKMIASVQVMNEKEVVAFWRAVHLFWELNPGRNTNPPPMVRHLLETAWARMDYIKRIGSMGDSCTLIDHVMSTYSEKAAA